ncbi:NAD-dependent epimerase/dehydratase family protein [Pseudotabrizicola alkalilacus]|uniref:NAD(P)-dependent oxidoreductase n=1 Tax=Pseudotabrizicola alkalilacus TaxID=2305252 RepID=A0A411Z718_9RHOB|nr:NAD(P)-dependent oxidoreductase [Pseudotabrizicola alkalilacus]RGP38908.1 NAD(P)-dependent oxidoreductase [Pseudotabrizicola alkalilacus]
MRVFFTGGSGKAGKHVIPYLVGQGHRVLNFDRVPLGGAGVHDLLGDVTDAGQVYSAMHSHAGYDELETGQGAKAFDAVVHFAAVPRMMMCPDTETWRVNVVGTYNVIEAAVKLGIRKVIVASSETTYGICFADGVTDPHSLPLTEDYDIDPMDTYGTSKKVNEVTARSFAQRSGADIYALRIGNVVEPQEYETLFPQYFANPQLRRRNAFNYVDARDLGQIVDLCLRKDGLGYQVFNACNSTNGMNIPNAELLARFFPDVPVTEELGPWDSLMSNRKIRDVLGFRDAHDWRGILPDHG